MKKLVKFVPLVIILATLGGCYLSCGPIQISYTLTWNPAISGFPNVNLTLTPIVPPKGLSLKPSDYVQVSITVGNFTFSTIDPDYQCLETVAATTLPIILAPEDEVISGFAAINDFLIVYQACGQFVQTSPVNLASRGGITAKELIFFQITGQKIVSRAANGQELTPSGPVGGPTPTRVSDTCIQGYVWREAGPGDHVCVTPRTRLQIAYDNSQADQRHIPGSDTCIQGYVWREAFANDHVCVTPETHAQAQYDNSQAHNRIVP